MSIYITFDEGPGEQVASNKGWGDFCRWAHTLPARPYLGVVQLADLGYANHPGALADQLGRAARELLPQAEGLSGLIASLADLLRANASEEAVFVTDGLAKSEAPDAARQVANEFGLTPEEEAQLHGP